ncbi:hypothetical protein AcW1_006448 [Taiwanofungus camphoratus]|nr:hypothetical protein AcW1_006448 [Antrodia cinnamomea]KAI0954613.1 hypothetical protein AcW1_006448 [Antrodia cinnamomea]
MGLGEGTAIGKRNQSDIASVDKIWGLLIFCPSQVDGNGVMNFIQALTRSVWRANVNHILIIDSHITSVSHTFGYLFSQSGSLYTYHQHKLRASPYQPFENLLV